MGNALRKSIEKFRMEGIIERIVSSKDTIETFHAIQSNKEKELNELKESIYLLNPVEIHTWEVVPFFTICMMGGIDYKEVIESKVLEAILQKVKGKERNIASRMMFYIRFRKFFSEDKLEELIVRFFKKW